MTRAPVADQVATALPLTLQLTFLALAGGVTAAVHRDRFPDQVIRVVSLVGVAAPGFWLALRRMSDRVVTMYLGRIVEETPAGRVTDRARHPYTRALFSASPGLLHPVDPIPLAGPVPSATRPPSGCPFRTRCWKADDVCAQVMPDFSAASHPGHRYRCHHPVEEDLSTRDRRSRE